MLQVLGFSDVIKSYVYITAGLQLGKAGLSTKIQSQMDKTDEFYVKPGMTQASKVAAST